MKHTQKPYALLLHGWGLNHHIFDSFCQQLPFSNAVLTPDLPGHNNTINQNDHFDADVFIDQLAKQIKTPIHLLGWSLGGYLALQFASRYPQLVKSLTLIATNCQFTSDNLYRYGIKDASLQTFAEYLEKDYTRYIEQFLNLQVTYCPEQESLIKQLLPKLTENGCPKGLVSALEFIQATRAQEILPMIQCPCLLIFGQKDTLVPIEAGTFLNNALPNSRLLILPKAAHTPFISHPEECYQTINLFWTYYDTPH